MVGSTSVNGGGVGGALTPVQLEGCLVFGQGTLLLALLNLLEESILALVRCGLAVRAGWKAHQVWRQVRAGGRCARAGRRTRSATGARGGQVCGLEGAPGLRQVPGCVRKAAVTERCGPFHHHCLARLELPSSLSSPLLPPPAGPSRCPLRPDEECAAPLRRSHSRGPQSSRPSRGRHAAAGRRARWRAHPRCASAWARSTCSISTMPAMVLRVIAALGFPCEREAGLAQVREGDRGLGTQAPAFEHKRPAPPLQVRSATRRGRACDARGPRPPRRARTAALLPLGRRLGARARGGGRARRS